MCHDLLGGDRPSRGRRAFIALLCIALFQLGITSAGAGAQESSEASPYAEELLTAEQVVDISAELGFASGGQDSDADGTVDYLDVDDDGDTIWTIWEFPDLNLDASDAWDFDGDGTPSYLDTDDDGDSVPTDLENPDVDNDNSPADGQNSDVGAANAAPAYLNPALDGRSGEWFSSHPLIAKALQAS